MMKIHLKWLLRAILMLAFLALAGCGGRGVDGGGSGGAGIPLPGFEVDSTRSDLDRAVRVSYEKYKGPVIDTHVHLDPPLDGVIREGALREIVEVVEEAGVERIIFMPTPNEGRFSDSDVGAVQKKRLSDMGGERVALFCGSDYITHRFHVAYRRGRAEKGMDDVLERLSRDLDGGACSGVGEIGLYHFRKKGNQKVISYPPDFQPFLEMARLVSEKGAWLDLHAEPVDPHGKSYEGQVFGGVELLFRLNPNLKLIVSHTGMTNPVNARRMLLAYPNIMMNFKIVKKHHTWRNLEPVVNTKGELYEDWARLFEEMPERFMVGTDAKFGRKTFNTFKYGKKIKQIRRALGSLAPDAARLIAHENARRMLGGGGTRKKCTILLAGPWSRGRRPVGASGPRHELTAPRNPGVAAFPTGSPRQVLRVRRPRDGSSRPRFLPFDDVAQNPNRVQGAGRLGTGFLQRQHGIIPQIIDQQGLFQEPDGVIKLMQAATLVGSVKHILGADIGGFTFSGFLHKRFEVEGVIRHTANPRQF